MHAHTHARTHTYMHTCMHACMHTCMHAHMHARTHAYTLTCMHARHGTGTPLKLTRRQDTQPSHHLLILLSCPSPLVRLLPRASLFAPPSSMARYAGHAGRAGARTSMTRATRASLVSCDKDSESLAVSSAHRPRASRHAQSTLQAPCAYNAAGVLRVECVRPAVSVLCAP